MRDYLWMRVNVLNRNMRQRGDGWWHVLDLTRPVKNNSTGLLAKPLNPQSLYESIVLHCAKKVTGRILK
jgi:hypothetical protein